MKKLLSLLVILITTSLMAQDDYTPSNKIQFNLKSISLSKNGPWKQDKTFRPGQVVWINLEVSGVIKDAEKNVNFQADLLMMDKNQRVILDNKNILNQKLFAGDIVPVITATFNITLFDNIEAGAYDVQITFRDVVGRKFNNYKTEFMVVK